MGHRAGGLWLWGEDRRPDAPGPRGGKGGGKEGAPPVGGSPGGGGVVFGVFLRFF